MDNLQLQSNRQAIKEGKERCEILRSVLDPGRGVCANPEERVAILEVKGPGPPGGVSERQLSPDRDREKT
jgi:hypothetical protein